MKTDLKPITFRGSRTDFNTPNIIKQNLLLKALPYTDDLQELKRIAKFHSEAEVLRALDKIAIRKEFHEALIDHELGIRTVVKGIKNLCDNAQKDETRLKGYQTILKALGLDKYEVEETSGRNWEELLVTIYDKEKEAKKLFQKPTYQVLAPVIPMEVKEKQDEMRRLEGSIFDTN